jgi:hypothetical protein
MGKRDHAQYALLRFCWLTIGIGAVLDAWRDRDTKTLRIANDKFRKLDPEEKRIMIMAIKEDERRTRQL